MADKVKMTQAVMFAKLEKSFGKGVATVLADSSEAKIVYWTSTGIYSLDDAMNWGLPGGRVVEFFGAESSGKTTALMSSFIENARRGGKNVVFDPEGTFDQDRYVQMGGDPKSLIIVDAGSLEEFYDKLKIVLEWARDQEVGTGVVLIGVDTLTTIIPKDILEAEGDDQPVAAASRVNARHLPTIDKNLPSNTCLVLLSQVRDKIGGMTGFGPADDNVDTPGGRIVKHVCSVRVFFKKFQQIDNGKTKEARRIMGMSTEAKVVKCKIGPPLRKVKFRIMFDERGVDTLNDLLVTLVDRKIVPAPVQGVYSVKDKGSFKVDEFPAFCKKFPKTTADMVDKAFELSHPSVNIARYF